MALQKISVDGDALRKAIKDNGHTISGVADKAKIGEKTAHRILNGELIRRDKVEQLFDAIKLSLDGYIDSEAGGTNRLSLPEIAYLNSECNFETLRGFYFNGYNETTLGKFVMPPFRDLPIQLVYQLDVPTPNEEQLSAIKSLNDVLGRELGQSLQDDIGFEAQYQKLSINHNIKSAIDTLVSSKLNPFFGRYTYWVSEEQENSYEHGNYVTKFYDSQNMLAILVTTKNLKGTVPAFLNHGDVPKNRFENDPSEYLKTIIDGFALPDIGEIPF